MKVLAAIVVALAAASGIGFAWWSRTRRAQPGGVDVKGGAAPGTTAKQGAAAPPANAPPVQDQATVVPLGAPGKGEIYARNADDDGVVARPRPGFKNFIPVQPRTGVISGAPPAGPSAVAIVAGTLAQAGVAAALQAPGVAEGFAAVTAPGKLAGALAGRNDPVLVNPAGTVAATAAGAAALLASAPGILLDGGKSDAQKQADFKASPGTAQKLIGGDYQLVGQNAPGGKLGTQSTAANIAGAKAIADRVSAVRNAREMAS